MADCELQNVTAAASVLDHMRTLVSLCSNHMILLRPELTPSFEVQSLSISTQCNVDTKQLLNRNMRNTANFSHDSSTLDTHCID